RQLLEELIQIDLEYRWRTPCPAGGAEASQLRPRLEQYGARFSELRSPKQFPVELIRFEYWVRQRWGDRPGHHEYLTRFPGHAGALPQMLAGVDQELAAEFAGAGSTSAEPAAAARDSGTTTPSRTALLAALQQSQALDTA